MEPKVLLEGWQSTTAIQSAFSTKLLPTYSFACLGVCISMQVCTCAYECCACHDACVKVREKSQVLGLASFFEAGGCQAI